MKTVRMSGKDAFKFEMSVKAGDTVLATWKQDQAPATVTAINAKSFSLDVNGRSITCPKFATPGYSSNNCILPASIFESQEDV